MPLPRRHAAPRRAGDHALVVGAGTSGLLAARVLTDFYDRVTVVERDPLGADQVGRPGAPQARHAHVLLPRGARALDGLFPGLLAELRTAGAPVAHGLDQLHFDFGGHLLSQAQEERSPLYGVSRQLLDRTLMRRVRSLTNVKFMDEHPALALQADRTGTRVTGVRVGCAAAFQGEVTVDADLVVAATGGGADGADVGAWLADLGHPTPQEERVPVEVTYASRRVGLAPGANPGILGLLIGPRRDQPLGLSAFAQEDADWVVTLAGHGRHRPPDDENAWLTSAAQVAPPWFLSALIGSRPLGSIHSHHFPASRRHRYDRLESFPEGLLVTGDALSSLNPIHGQGVTVAALEALALRDTLRAGTYDLAERFFQAAAKPVATAWQFALAADLAMPADVVPGARSLPRRAVSAYLSGFQSAAERDPALARQFMDVSGLERPARSLLAPQAVGRMVSSRLRRDRSGSGAMPALGSRQGADRTKAIS